MGRPGRPRSAADELLLREGPLPRERVILEMQKYVLPGVAARTAATKWKTPDDPRRGDPYAVGSRTVAVKTLGNALTKGVYIEEAGYIRHRDWAAPVEVGFLNLTPDEAERLTTRIRLRLDTIAENTEVVVTLIEEARAGAAHEALGYPSWPAYVADRFGGALTRLAKAERVPLVQMLSDQGMSTRAIAPVVGVSNKTVSLDLREPVTEVTPVTFEGEDFTVLANATEEEFEVALAQSRAEGDLSRENVEKKIATAKTVTGMDGKTYTRPKPVPTPPRPVRRRSLPDAFASAVWDLEKIVNRLERLAADDRVKANIEVLELRLDRVAHLGARLHDNVVAPIMTAANKGGGDA